MYKCSVKLRNSSKPSKPYIHQMHMLGINEFLKRLGYGFESSSRQDIFQASPATAQIVRKMRRSVLFSQAKAVEYWPNSSAFLPGPYLTILSEKVHSDKRIKYRAKLPLFWNIK